MKNVISKQSKTSSILSILFELKREFHLSLYKEIIEINYLLQGFNILAVEQKVVLLQYNWIALLISILHLTVTRWRYWKYWKVNAIYDCRCWTLSFIESVTPILVPSDLYSLKIMWEVDFKFQEMNVTLFSIDWITFKTNFLFLNVIIIIEFFNKLQK